MHVRDTFSSGMRGQVWGAWIDGAGNRFGLPLRFNTLSYGCADILAGLVAGKPEFKPVKMGFVYGDNASPGLLPVTREQSWATVESEVSTINSGNMQISAFSMPPAVSIDDSSYTPVGYTGNSVTFSGITRSGSGTYGFPLSAPYAGVLTDGHYLYQAVLLSSPVDGTYIPIARVSLANSGTYAVKPAGYELSLFWQVSFF